MIPGLRRHTRGGWTVRLSGEDHYFPEAATEAEARRWYDGMVARWLAGGRKPLGTPRGRKDGVLTVRGLVERYREHADIYYLKERERGRRERTSAWRRAVGAAERLERTFGDMAAADFTRAEFKAVRNTWTAGTNDRGVRNSRETVNKMGDCVRACFAWGAAEGLVPAVVLAEIDLVGHLPRGRCGLDDRPAVPPAPEDAVEAVLAVAEPPLAAMIRLQRWTGMRPGEVCGLRRKHLAMEGEVWRYDVPASVNKSEHTGRGRVVWIGPRARAVLVPYLDRQPAAGGGLFFSSRGRPFTPAAYRDAVAVRCRRAGVAHWHPNQLRHSAATEIARAEAMRGLDAAMRSLGHSQSAVTRRYVEDRGDVERRIAEAMG